MTGRSFSFGNSGNPLAQGLALVVLAVILVGAVIMGAFVLMALLGMALLGFVGYTLRGWWLRRRAGRGGSFGGPGGPEPGGQTKGIRYIEGEYEVIEDAEAKRRRSRDRT
jgi:hypothetical protein